MNAIFFYLRRLYAFAGKRYLMNFAGMLLIGLMESLGVILILPLLSMIGLFEMDTNEMLDLSWLIGIFENIPREQGLAIILSIYLLMMIGAGLFQRHQTLVNKQIEQGFVRRLREESYMSLIQADWAFFLQNRKSDMVKLLTTEIANVKKGLNICTQFSYSMIFAGVKIVVAFCLSPQITMFTMLFALILLLCSRYFTWRSAQFGRQNLALSREYAAGITDHLNGIKDIKSNTLEVSRVKWIRTISSMAERNSMEYARLKTNSQFLFRTVRAILLAVFIWFIVSTFHSQPAQLLLVMLIFSRIWPIVNQIQNNLESLAAMAPSFEAFADFQKSCEAAQEVKVDGQPPAERVRLTHGIELRDVFFQYRSNEGHYALKNISAYIPANRMTAVVGPSGAGKSTLIDIITGLNRPQQGRVLIDGIPLTNANVTALRRSISYVPQDPFLFNGSIRDNLLLMNPDAAEEHLWEALELSSAKEFVMKLPDRLDTIIGDRGVRLSGGERQRLVFARAILRKPAILILDEATSALDHETEMKIKETIERLKGEMTIIAIAHRPSTIQNADHIIELNMGEIIRQERFFAAAAAGVNS